jgi:hypothetical protein
LNGCIIVNSQAQRCRPSREDEWRARSDVLCVDEVAAVDETFALLAPDVSNFQMYDEISDETTGN